MHYTIDTLKLVLPVNPDWEELTCDFFSRTDSWHWCKYNPVSREVRLFNLSRQVKPKSWHKTLYLSYRDQKGFGPSVVLEFSLPKASYGNNVGLWPWWRSDFTHVMGAVQRYLIDSIDPDQQMQTPISPDHGEWGLLRLDLAWAWKFSDDFEAQAALDCLKRYRFKWRNPVLYSTGIQYPSRYSPAKFYLKGPEFCKHDLKNLSQDEQVDKDALEIVQRQAEGLLRFEVTLRGRALKELSIGTVSDLDAVDLGEVLRSFLGRCTGLDGNYLSEASLSRELKILYSRAKTARLLDFCRILSIEGEAFALRRYGVDAFYRNKRDLRAAIGEKGLVDISEAFNGRDLFKFETETLMPNLQAVKLYRS